MWHDVNEGYSCSVISKYSLGILSGHDHSLFESKLVQYLYRIVL